jgi:hypothetical protein
MFPLMMLFFLLICGVIFLLAAGPMAMARIAGAGRPT